jgi:hypothetical protein
MSEENKEIKSIISDLQSGDTAKILDALKRNRKDGNKTTFKAVLLCLKDTDDPDVEANIIQFLHDLKDESSIPLLIEAIEDEAYSYYHSFLIASFWQSSLDGSDYIELFIKKAIENDYMTALEVLTVVENFDNFFSQDELIEFEADINEAVLEEQNEEKKKLLESLADVVRNLPIEGE